MKLKRDTHSLVTIKEWRTPATDYPDRRLGNARLYKQKYARGGIWHAHGARGYRFFKAGRTFWVKTLTVNDDPWMLDDPLHWWTICKHAAVYRGHVLVAGLGLGLVVHALDRNPLVSKITVLEIEPDVIELVAPMLPQRKLEIVTGDFWEHAPIYRPDGIFFDLFVGETINFFDQACKAYARLQILCSSGPVRILGFPHTLLEKVNAEIARRVKVAYEGFSRAI